VVAVAGPDRTPLARDLSAYPSADAPRIGLQRSGETETILSIQGDPYPGAAPCTLTISM